MELTRLQLLLTFLEKAPQDSFTLYSIGHEYMKQGDFQGAIKYFQQLLAHDPAYIGAYYHYAKAFLELEQSEEAEKTIELGIAKATELKDTHAAAELRSLKDELMDW